MTRTQRTRRGVSLLELLMVLAIIALLLSIVLPALSFSNELTIRTQCTNKLRQIMAFASLYAQADPKNIVGPVHYQAPSFSGEGYAEYGGGPGSAPFMDWVDPFDPRTRPLNHLIFGRGNIVDTAGPGECPQFDLFRCPGDDRGWQEWPGFGGNPEEMEQPYYVANGTSYRMNNLSWTDGTIGGIYGRMQTRIPDPGVTIAFMEARTFQTLYTNDTWGFLEHGELTGYHGLLAHFNVAYADGHADFANFGNGTYHARLPQYFNKDVRGSWGRMDCLPDAFLSDYP